MPFSCILAPDERQTGEFAAWDNMTASMPRFLEVLQADGRLPNAALAEKVGLSQSACSRRLDRLEKEGFI